MCKAYNQFEEIFRQNREGWTYARTSAGDLWVGYSNAHASDITWFKDTTENRAEAESYWEAYSFSRETKNNFRTA